jgi:hypothetical protein
LQEPPKEEEIPKIKAENDFIYEFDYRILQQKLFFAAIYQVSSPLREIERARLWWVGLPKN